MKKGYNLMQHRRVEKLYKMQVYFYVPQNKLGIARIISLRPSDAYMCR